MLSVSTSHIVLISGPDAHGRHLLADDLATSTTSVLFTSRDLDGVIEGTPETSVRVLMALVVKQVARGQSVVVDLDGPADEIGAELESLALRNGAKFAPVVCFDGTSTASPDSSLGASSAGSEAGPNSVSAAAGWGSGIAVDTSVSNDDALRDVVAFIQSLDGHSIQTVAGCKFCDHAEIRRRAVRILQNEWCMFSVEKIQGRLVGAVTPLRHAATVFDLNASEWAASGALLRSGLRHLDAEVHPDSFIVGWNTKSTLSGDLPHAQLRIVPYFAPVEADAPEVTSAEQRPVDATESMEEEGERPPPIDEALPSEPSPERSSLESSSNGDSLAESTASVGPAIPPPPPNTSTSSIPPPPPARSKTLPPPPPGMRPSEL